jgi:signal transduction histidine kinase
MTKKYAPLLSKEVDYQNIAETIVRMAPAYRNPFVAIIGYGEALLEGLSGQLTEAQSKDIEAVCVSGWQALGQLNDILEVMQVISGEIIYDDLPIDIQQLFRVIERDIERGTVVRRILRDFICLATLGLVLDREVQHRDKDAGRRNG